MSLINSWILLQWVLKDNGKITTLGKFLRCKNRVREYCKRNELLQCLISTTWLDMIKMKHISPVKFIWGIQYVGVHNTIRWGTRRNTFVKEANIFFAELDNTLCQLRNCLYVWMHKKSLGSTITQNYKWWFGKSIRVASWATAHYENKKVDCRVQDRLNLSKNSILQIDFEITQKLKTVYVFLQYLYPHGVNILCLSTQFIWQVEKKCRCNYNLQGVSKISDIVFNPQKFKKY